MHDVNQKQNPLVCCTPFSDSSGELMVDDLVLLDQDLEVFRYGTALIPQCIAFPFTCLSGTISQHMIWCTSIGQPADYGVHSHHILHVCVVLCAEATAGA